MAEKRDQSLEFLGCLFVLVCFPFIIALRGWVTTILWGWFLTPVTGIPVPGIATCIGLVILLSLMAGKTILQKDTEPGKELDKPINGQAVALLVRPLADTLVTLALGWAIHLFV